MYRVRFVLQGDKFHLAEALEGQSEARPALQPLLMPAKYRPHGGLPAVPCVLIRPGRRFHEGRIDSLVLPVSSVWLGPALAEKY